MGKSESHWSGLMRAANRGDATAYRRLLEELTPVLRRMVSRAFHGCGSGDAADDAQRTLVPLYVKRHTWDDSRPLLPWVQASARNKLADNLRRRRRQIQLPIDDIAETLAEQPVVDTDRVDVARLLS